MAKEAAGHESWGSFARYARWAVTDELRDAMEGRTYGATGASHGRAGERPHLDADVRSSD